MEVKPGYKQTEVGIIPADWHIKRLPEVCRFRAGKAHERFISDFGRFVCVNSKFISTDGEVRKYTTTNLCPAQKNDVLLVMSDLPNGRALAKAYLVEQDNLYAVNQRVCALTAYCDCPQYLFYVLNRSPYFLRFDDGVNQTHLLNPVFLKCPVVLPREVTEQLAIATALTDVDALLAKLDRLIVKKRDLKQAAMQKLLTGRTRLPGFTGKWEVKPLAVEVSDLEAGVSVNSVEYEFASGSSNLAVLKTSAVASGRFIQSECKTIAARDLRRVKLSPIAESVIISRMNTIDLVGECGYVPSDFPTLFVPDRLWVTRFKANSRVSAKWLACVLTLPASRRLIRNIATGTSGSMKNIGKEKFLALEFAFPSTDEQTAIAAVLTDMDTELAALEQRLAKTRDIKQGIMQELLTGRTRLVSRGTSHA